MPAALAFVVALALQRIVLSSPNLDARVNVFPERRVLDAYTANVWTGIDTDKAYWLIVEPGTRAVVVDVKGQDIGVKLTSGEYRGRYGWVARSDATAL